MTSKRVEKFQATRGEVSLRRSTPAMLERFERLVPPVLRSHVIWLSRCRAKLAIGSFEHGWEGSEQDLSCPQTLPSLARDKTISFFDKLPHRGPGIENFPASPTNGVLADQSSHLA